MNVESKVYYLKENGKVVYTTGEFSGGVIKTTFEDDYNIVEALKQYPINEIGCIEIEFGTYLNTFVNAKSYVVDLATKQLKVEYHTTEEVQVIENQEEEIETLNNRISDISNYLSEQTESIADIEDYILQTELNKIMEGMI